MVSPKKGKVYPHIWLVGPDPAKKQLHTDYLRHKAQAKYRKEDFDLTLDEYIEIWMKDDNHLNKGRSPHNVCLSRKDPDGAWTKDNVEIMSRAEHFRERCGRA